MTATREKTYLMRESVTRSSNASVSRAMRNTREVPGRHVAARGKCTRELQSSISSMLLLGAITGDVNSISNLLLLGAGVTNSTLKPVVARDVWVGCAYYTCPPLELFHHLTTCSLQADTGQTTEINERCLSYADTYRVQTRYGTSTAYRPKPIIEGVV